MLVLAKPCKGKEETWKWDGERFMVEFAIIEIFQDNMGGGV